MFPESTILCVILSNREDPLHTYVHVCKTMYVSQSSISGPALAFSPRLAYVHGE